MREQKIILLIGCLFLSLTSHCQFTDDFSDGDFTTNPAWSGENSKFVVQSGKLKLQAPPFNDEAYLSTPSHSIHNGVWEFYLQMEFNPSSTNLAKIYLVADQADLKGDLEGYFVKAGNTTDEISLYRQDGGVETEIVDGLDGRLNLATMSMKIKVTRNPSGLWQLFSDVGPTGSYVLEGAAVDNTHTLSTYSGVRCTYTSTRSDKFWFDDFVVDGTPVPDTTPPTLLAVDVPAAVQILLTFSETLDPVSAEDVSNYEMTNVVLSSAQLQADQRTVLLVPALAMKNGVTSTLQLSGIKDIHDNPMETVSVKVLFFQPIPSKHKDIIITELLPDPSPHVSLPEAEFIELFNRSSSPFNLSGWTLSDGSSVSEFPDQIILPGEYWIATAAASASLFKTGKVIGLSNFPTLNNSGDNITLKNSLGQTIDSVHYTQLWYRDEDKQQGGWSLELIDPENPCGEQDNWTASENESGGTPGFQNSAYANKPDLTGPALVAAFPESHDKIVLSFSEMLEPLSVVKENFEILPNPGIESVSCSKDLRTIELKLLQPLEVRQLYTLSVNSVRDCSGNEMAETKIETALPEDAESGDAIVNEILFNPKPGGVDFVEIYNVSSKYLNLKNWKLGNLSDENAANAIEAVSSNRLLLPGDFVVFTPDATTLMSQYPQSRADRIIESSIPSLPDDEGSITLNNDSGKFLDGLSYSDQWHSILIKEEEGVSLERIDPRGPSGDRNNWMSTSSLSGFATPGFANSHLRMSEDTGDVSVVPEVFAPETGPEEFVQIKYRFDPADWTANVKIFDQRGHLLKTIANNETLATEGFFRWDGDTDDRLPALRGYYVIFFEAFNSEGETRTFRKRVIVFPR